MQCCISCSEFDSKATPTKATPTKKKQRWKSRSVSSGGGGGSGRKGAPPPLRLLSDSGRLLAPPTERSRWREERRSTIADLSHKATLRMEAGPVELRLLRGRVSGADVGVTHQPSTESSLTSSKRAKSYTLASFPGLSDPTHKAWERGYNNFAVASPSRKSYLRITGTL